MSEKPFSPQPVVTWGQENTFLLGTAWSQLVAKDYLTCTSHRNKFLSVTKHQILPVPHVLTQHGTLTRDRHKSMSLPSPRGNRTCVNCSEDQSSNTVLHENLPLILSVQFSWFRSSCNWQTEVLDHHVTGLYSVVTEFHSVTPLLNIITNTKITCHLGKKKPKSLLPCFRPFKINVLIFCA